MYNNVSRAIWTVPLVEDGLGTANTLIAIVIKKPITIHKVEALVTATLGAQLTTVAVLSISHTASGGSIAEKDTITLGASGAVGTIYEGADTSMPFDCLADGTITLKVKTAANAAGTGKVYWMLYYSDIPHR